jgi:hypothetical protein
MTMRRRSRYVSSSTLSLLLPIVGVDVAALSLRILLAVARRCQCGCRCCLRSCRCRRRSQLVARGSTRSVGGGWSTGVGFAVSSGMVALGTAVSGIEQMKKRKNEPRQHVVVHFRDAHRWPPTSCVSPSLSPFPPSCSPCPNPSSSENEPPTSLWKGEGRCGWGCASSSPECW